MTTDIVGMTLQERLDYGRELREQNPSVTLDEVKKMIDAKDLSDTTKGELKMAIRVIRNHNFWRPKRYDTNYVDEQKSIDFMEFVGIDYPELVI